MALEAGFDFSFDDPRYRLLSGELNLRTPILAIQAALKFPLKPGKTFMIEPYFGATYNMPMGSQIEPSNFTAMVGLDYGVKAGEGCLFIGLSYGMDIEMTSITANSLAGVTESLYMTEYRRTYLSLTLGYKYGFISRPERVIK
jgi:hypothetical protein